jgi:hypothetical protein
VQEGKKGTRGGIRAKRGRRQDREWDRRSKATGQRRGEGGMHERERNMRRKGEGREQEREQVRRGKGTGDGHWEEEAENGEGRTIMKGGGGKSSGGGGI